MDTGAESSCISYSLYKDINTPKLCTDEQVKLEAADGSDLGCVGSCQLTVTIAKRTFNHRFYVCKYLQRSCICGQDFLVQNNLMLKGDKTTGRLCLKFPFQKHTAHKVYSITRSIKPEQHDLRLKQDVRLSPRSVSAVLGTVPLDILPSKSYWQTTQRQPPALKNRDTSLDPLLFQVPPTYRERNLYIPVVIVNHEDREVWLNKGTVIAYIEPLEGEVIPESSEKAKTINEVHHGASEELGGDPELREGEKLFLTSPADVETHPKIVLSALELPKKLLEKFEALCSEFDCIFSKGSSDIGETELIKMYIDTGDHPPIAQRPYTLALKHLEWLKKELLTLEEAGVIVRSISPWASPIVVVPKKSAPGEAPRRRMCVDYRAINALLPEVRKVGSSAKGVLTQFPLPKIDEMYGDLAGTTVFSNLDVRSGYHHIGLTEDSKPKTAFVVQNGKWEFNRVPFGLSQAPAYFQAMINLVLNGLPFAKGYLDDILIFSKNAEEHLDHLREVFRRLKNAKLKLKREKCDFFKGQVFYLGHLLSAKGIYPMPEKLEALKNIAPPKTVKQVQSFMGIANYYRKFVPRFSDVARPLTQLTRKDEDFEWTEQRDKAFNHLKDALTSAPILRYPDPDRPYVLFTDASKYGWGAMLSQPHTDDEDKEILHPVHYLSGLFRGSQLNWAALTKEAHAIYAAVRKLTFYLTDADVTLRSDHKPLKRFLQQETLNNMVNNWAMELQQFRIKFEFIEGRKNTLADALSRLLTYQPEIELDPEPPGQEYGYALFSAPEKIIISVVTRSMTAKQSKQANIPVTPSSPSKTNSPSAQPSKKTTPKDTSDMTTTKDDDLTPIGDDLDVKMDLATFVRYQQNDDDCQQIIAKIAKNPPDYPFILDKGLLCKRVPINLTQYEVPVVPYPLRQLITRTAHEQGHNGANRTYQFLRRNFYWPRMKKTIAKCLQTCVTCLQANRQPMRLQDVHSEVPKIPMDFICMDLIGNFPMTTSGHCYALTAIDMLTSYVWAVPLPDKRADSIVQAFLTHIYPYGMPRKILTDNGTEFVNATFQQVAEELGCEHKITSPAYHPQSNGKLEGFHYFLKRCTSKHLTKHVEWDQVLHLACAAYNFFPSETSQESPFFLMFHRDPRMKLTDFLRPRYRYIGDDNGRLQLDILHACYWIAVSNIQQHRTRQNPKIAGPPRFREGDLVFLKDHTAKSFEPKYTDPHRVLQVYPTRLTVVNQKGQTKDVHITDAKNVPMTESILKTLPDLQAYGRLSKYVVDPTKLPAPPKLDIYAISSRVPFLKGEEATDTQL